MSQYVGSELSNYPMWDSSVLYQSPPPTHSHVNEHSLYRQPCALLHQRYTKIVQNFLIRNLSLKNPIIVIFPHFNYKPYR